MPRCNCTAMLVALVFAEFYPDPPRYPVVQVKPTTSASQLTMDTFDFGEVQIAATGKQSCSNAARSRSYITSLLGGNKNSVLLCFNDIQSILLIIYLLTHL